MHSGLLSRVASQKARTATFARQASPLIASSYYQQPSVHLAPATSFSTSSVKMSVQAINSYDEFKKIIEGDKIAAIDFWATWCGPCKMISPLFEKFAANAPADQIAFYKVDVDEQEKISAEVGISAMPTFVFFKNGQKVKQMVGAVPQQLQQTIQDVVKENGA